jgi:hypothetical protein
VLCYCVVRSFVHARVCVCVCVRERERERERTRLPHYWWRKDFPCYDVLQTPCNILFIPLRSINHNLGTNLNWSEILPITSCQFSHSSSHHISRSQNEGVLMFVCSYFPSYIGISEVSFIGLSLCSYFQIYWSSSFILFHCCNLGDGKGEGERDTQTHKQFQEFVLFLPHYKYLIYCPLTWGIPKNVQG